MGERSSKGLIEASAVPSLWLLTLVFACGWVVLYLISGWFSVLPEASLWFLPAGWTVAFVIIGGWRAWPLAFSGPWLTGLVLQIGAAGLLDYLILDLRHVLCYGGAAVVLRYRLHAWLPLRNLRSCFYFLYIALAASLISAVVSSLYYWLRGVNDLRRLAETGLSFLVGDAAGVILVVPAVMSLFVVLTRGLSEWRKVSEMRSPVVMRLLRLSVMLGLVWLVFGPAGKIGAAEHLSYLLILPIIWVAVSDGPHGVAVAVVAMNLAIAGAAHLFGTSQSLLSLQLLVMTATSGGLLLAAALVDRALAHQRVCEQERQLQRLVDRRTLELTEVNRSLRLEVAERCRAEVELQQARDAAQQASRAKTRFLANMSHEVRTPLHAILGMSDLILTGELDADQREFATTLRSSAVSLLQIVNDILDVSRIEAGRLVLEDEAFDLLTTVGETLETVAPRCQAKEIELSWVVDAEVPVGIRGDPGRLRQILLNLLDNAAKFTDQGKISLRIGLRELSAGQALVGFDVRDTGVGIPEAAQEGLFEAFSQVDGSTTRRWGGSGLGLAISRNLVEMMGGEISVVSELGSGSCFTFTASFGLQPEAGLRPPRLSFTAAGSRILVASTHDETREALCKLLDRWSLEHDVAVGPVEIERCLDRCRQLARAREGAREPAVATRLYLAIVADVHLVQRLTKEGSLDEKGLSRIGPLILVAGRERSTVGHSQRLLTRPIRPIRLRDLLEGLELVSEDQPGGQASAAESTETAMVRILVAEDNPVNQRVAAIVLERMGYRVDVVATGVEAVRSVLASSYGLVLMDCQMPEMDGYEAATEIRRIEESESDGRRTPIVALTAHAMAGDRQRCLDAGMDDYLSKPVVAAELATMVERWLDLEH